MSIYRLHSVFEPASIALVGASANPRALGHAVLSNMRKAGFPGRIDLVNPRHTEIQGLHCAPSLTALPSPPELIVIATPAQSIPDIIAEAARIGVRAAIILSAGLGHGPGSLAAQVNATARAHGLRIVGPNCLGVIAPFSGLNASFAASSPARGGLAVISQSGAVAAAMTEWGNKQGLGFSAIVSLGDQLDVDIGDLIDYFASDRHTRAILLYVESITDARKFMSASRAAARIKPVVVMKSGRHAQGAKAAATHTGALAGADAVYDAAFRRAGLLRVYDMAETFAAAETLSHVRSLRGSRLAILTNGGGLGVLAVDRLADHGYTPAALSEDVRARLSAVMPHLWSGANPVDIVGDADADRYTQALQALVDDPLNDAVLVLNVQTAMATATDTARAVCGVVESARTRHVEPKPVFASWVGSDTETDAIFAEAKVPSFPTEAEAVRGFVHLVRRMETMRALMEAPPATPDDNPPDESAVRAIIDTALREQRSWLDPLEVAAVLDAYSIPAPPIVQATDPDHAVELARAVLAQDQLVAVKILSRDIPHKSDVDGVRLNLKSDDAVRKAAAEVMANAARLQPGARIDGVMLQPMIVRKGARELILGIALDPTFGPVIAFGQGGVAVEVINDKALALPPLDLRLADDLIGRTRIAALLAAYRNVPAARRDEIALVLVRLSQLAADFAEIRELDINPLLADQHGVLALDARIAIGPAPAKRIARASHLAIRPYPKEWIRTIHLRDGMRIAVRPVRPEDEPLFVAFFPKVTQGDLRMRFFAPIKDFSHAFMARLTQIDYGRAMALLALDETSGEMLGVVRMLADPDYRFGEYAILLRSDMKGRGLGWALMETIIDYARKDGLQRLQGQVLRENTTMLKMCHDLGFAITDDPEDDGLKTVILDLARPA
jgi:acetyltransferase